MMLPGSSDKCKAPFHLVVDLADLICSHDYNFVKELILLGEEYQIKKINISQEEYLTIGPLSGVVVLSEEGWWGS